VWVAPAAQLFARGGKTLHTQAAVSNRIATLERDLGVRLFERDLPMSA